MTYHNDKIAALIGSRICHDLISPIGAVSNGLELMALSQGDGQQEMALVSESAAQANARIRLFRLAFGLVADNQTVAANDIRQVLSDAFSDGRVDVTWSTSDVVPRLMTQAAVLALLCADRAIPHGGQLTVEEQAGVWTVTAQGARISTSHTVWKCLSWQPPPDDLKPADVQFLLLPGLLAENGRTVHYSFSGQQVTLQF